jgi:multidrug efflux pump
MFVALKPRDERAIDADGVIRPPALATVAGAPTFLQPVQDLRVGGRPSSSQYQYTLQGERFDEPRLGAEARAEACTVPASRTSRATSRTTGSRRRS